MASKLGALDLVMAEYFRDVLGACVGNVAKLPDKYMTVHWEAQIGLQLPSKPRVLTADGVHVAMPGAMVCVDSEDVQQLGCMLQPGRDTRGY